eukprot:2657886-Rhodomonas_salina.1
MRRRNQNRQHCLSDHELCGDASDPSIYFSDLAAEPTKCGVEFKWAPQWSSNDRCMTQQSGRGVEALEVGGRRIDLPIDSARGKQAVELVLQQLRKGSAVFEWGTGASAVYFSQCVK